MVNLVGQWYMDCDENCLLLYEWDGKWENAGHGQRRKNIKRLHFYSNIPDLLYGFGKIINRDLVGETSSIHELNSRIAEMNDILREIGERLTLDMPPQAVSRGQEAIPD